MRKCNTNSTRAMIINRIAYKIEHCNFVVVNYEASIVLDGSTL